MSQRQQEKLKQQIAEMIDGVDDINLLQAQVDGIIDTQASYYYSEFVAIDIINTVIDPDSVSKDQLINSVRKIVQNSL